MHSSSHANNLSPAAKLMLLTLCCSALIVTLRAQSDSVSTGVASYYANKFQGRKTSSGEVFDQNRLTAAHKTLPFGTLVQVKNLTNDSTVVVTINDRLPKSSSRMIDLSYAAADQLNFIRKGLTKVEIRLLPPVLPKAGYEASETDSTAGE
jgi:rare lipoprotein A